MDLNRILTEGYGPGAWHGADIKAAIADVSSIVAFKRPRPGRHNIAEIVLHHAFYVHAVRGRLLGTAIEPFVLDGEDWFPLEANGPLAWDAITAALETLQGRLASTVSGIAAGTIASPLDDGARLGLVLGITCHSAYHAGQIQLIKLLV